MVVDDNRDAAQMLVSLLKALGHEALAHASAESALADEAALPGTQVFILDIGLPQMDGYALARRLRAKPQTQSAVLIALTALWPSPQPRAGQVGRV